MSSLNDRPKRRWFDGTLPVLIGAVIGVPLVVTVALSVVFLLALEEPLPPEDGYSIEQPN